MAIIDVTEDGKAYTGGDDVTSGEHRRKFIVAFDDADEPAKRPLIALASPQIPQGLSVHPYNNWLFVARRDYYMEGPFVVIIDVTYSSKPITANEWATAANPLTTPWDIEWFMVEHEDVIEAAFDDNGQQTVPIINAVGDPPDPPMTESHYFQGLRITRYEATFNENNAWDYTGAVNSDYFRGYPPKAVKMTKIDGRRVIAANGFICWQVTYEMLFNYFTWTRRALHHGYHYYDSDGVKTQVTDGHGAPSPQPACLNLDGTLVPKYGEKKYIYFNTLRAKPFASLNLNF